MNPEAWFDQLRSMLPGEEQLVPSDGETELLLDLARIAAHTSERWTAPITTFLVGVAVGGQPPGDREAALRSLVGRLEDDR